MGESQKKMKMIAEPKSCHMLEIGITAEDFSICQRYIYRDIDQIIACLQWFFGDKKRPNYENDARFTLCGEARVNLWEIRESHISSVVDLKPHIQAKYKRTGPVFLDQPEKITGKITEEKLTEYKHIKFLLDLDAIRSNSPELSGDLLDPGQIIFVKLDPSLEEKLEPLLESKSPGEHTLCYGPWSKNNEDTLEGFPDPDPLESPESSMESALRNDFSDHLEKEDFDSAQGVIDEIKSKTKKFPADLQTLLFLKQNQPWEALANSFFALFANPESENLVDESLKTCKKASADEASKFFSCFEEGIAERKLIVSELPIPEFIKKIKPLKLTKYKGHVSLLEAAYSLDNEEKYINHLIEASKSEDDPECAAVAGYFLGLIYYENSQPVDAIQAWERAAKLAVSPRILLRYAEAIERDDQKLSLEYITQAVQLLNSQQEEATENMLLRFFRMFRYQPESYGEVLETAAETLKRVGRLRAAAAVMMRRGRDKYWSARVEGAKLLVDAGDHQEALEAFKQCIKDWGEIRKKNMYGELYKKYTECWYYRAREHSILGNGEQALHALNVASEREGKYRSIARKDVAFKPLWKTSEFVRIARGEGEEEVKTISQGARVEHVKYGQGTVEEVQGQGEKAKLTVAFDEGGTKKMIARFLKSV